MKVVEKRRLKNSKTLLLLNNKRKLFVSRFCCVSEKNTIVKKNNEYFVQCKNGFAKIFPLYSSTENIEIGKKKLSLTVKEIECNDEYNEYLRLTEFHYKGHGIASRTAVLVISSNDNLLPRILGYIELCGVTLENSARNKILNAEYNDGNIVWKTWNKKTAYDYANTIVRISRVVVLPEFRGLKLAKLLVRHAILFAKTSWTVAEYKLIFIEIIADMLKYVPFVSSEGMYYIGRTKGNLSVVKNRYGKISSHSKKRKTGGSIVKEIDITNRQLQKIADKEAISVEKLLWLLNKKPNDLSNKMWQLLSFVYRFPKPVYFAGLTDYSTQFLERRLSITKQIIRKNRLEALKLMNTPIVGKNLSLQFDCRIQQNRSLRKIQQAFEIGYEKLTNIVFRELNFRIEPGDVVLICGASGSGKTSLLKLLKHKLQGTDKKFEGLTGQLNCSHKDKISVFSVLNDSVPLFEALENRDTKNAINALNIAGLAEAHLYVKKFNELSNGQQYRAMLAKLVASRASVWLADEFCSTLDWLTSNIIARSLRKCAKEMNVTAILSAANWTHFIYELRPDKVIFLRGLRDYCVYDWDEFDKLLCESKVYS